MTPTELLEATKRDGGAMPLIISLDASVRELRDDLHAFKREVKGEITDLRLDVAALSGNVKALGERSDKHLAGYKAIVSEIRSELKGDIVEMKGDIKAISARLDAQQMRLGWHLTIFGIVIAVVVAAIQLWR